MSRAFTPIKVGHHKGKDIFEISLESPVGVKISLLNYGALIRDWEVPVKGEEAKRHVVLGFDSFDSYPDHSPYFGAIIGRVTNRIKGAKFKLNEREYTLVANEPPNHLHGGPEGLGKQVWDLEVLNDDPKNRAVQFTLTSLDGDQGYPGNLTCFATYRLQDYRLYLTLEAKTDAPTPVNLTQHNYFNLESKGCDVSDHLLQICSSKVLELGAGQLPTGNMMQVSEGVMDFRHPKNLKNEAGEPVSIDNSFVLDKNESKRPAVVLEAPDKKLKLKLWTDQPSVHVYTSGFLDLPIPGVNNAYYPRFGAICLEDQNFVDAINHQNFPSCILQPGEVYKHECEIEIKPV